MNTPPSLPQKNNFKQKYHKSIDDDNNDNDHEGDSLLPREINKNNNATTKTAVEGNDCNNNCINSTTVVDDTLSLALMAALVNTFTHNTTTIGTINVKDALLCGHTTKNVKKKILNKLYNILVNLTKSICLDENHFYSCLQTITRHDINEKSRFSNCLEVSKLVTSLDDQKQLVYASSDVEKTRVLGSVTKLITNKLLLLERNNNKTKSVKKRTSNNRF